MSHLFTKASIEPFRSTLIMQFDIAWQLLEYHLNNLEDEECMWRPSKKKGLHVWEKDNYWIADWPDTEDYTLGAPSIAWITWHIIFWWSMVFDSSFGEGTLSREEINWPGDMKEARKVMIKYHEDWRAILVTISEEEFIAMNRTKWPFDNRPFYELAAWLNLELMKNASEIGTGRFLYGARN